MVAYNMSIIFSCISLTMAFLALVISWRSYRLNHKAFEMSIKPFVTLEIIPDYKANLNLFVIQAKNDGFTCARDIKFKVLTNNALADRIGEIGFIQSGIPSLSPKQELYTFIFNANREKPLLDLSVDIQIEYLSQNDKRYADEYCLSLKHFREIQHFNTYEKRSATSLEKIAKTMGKVAENLDPKRAKNK